MIVTFGVVFYQKAKQMEAAEKQEQSSLNESSSDHHLQDFIAFDSVEGFNQYDNLNGVNILHFV